MNDAAQRRQRADDLVENAGHFRGNRHIRPNRSDDDARLLQLGEGRASGVVWVVAAHKDDVLCASLPEPAGGQQVPDRPVRP